LFADVVPATDKPETSAEVESVPAAVAADVAATDESGAPPSDTAAATGVAGGPVDEDAAPRHELENAETMADEEEQLDKEDLGEHAGADEPDEVPDHDDVRNLLRSGAEDEPQTKADTHVSIMSQPMCLCVCVCVCVLCYKSSLLQEGWRYRKGILP